MTVKFQTAVFECLCIQPAVLPVSVRGRHRAARGGWRALSQFQAGWSAAEPGRADRHRAVPVEGGTLPHAAGVYRELKIWCPALRDGLCRSRKEEL